MALALLAAACAQGIDLPPNFRRSYSDASTTLRAALFGGGYDFTSPPTSDRLDIYSKAGTSVALQIRFFKVEDVSLSQGSMRLKVWLRTRWVDKRLSWTPAEYGNITQIWVATLDEHKEIWLPDLTHYNSKSALAEGFDSPHARVESDGTVFWSRNGVLDVMCKFSGLVSFPKDKLSCQIEFGGWIHRGGVQGIEALDGGYAFETQEATSGSSYQEFTIESVNYTAVTYTYSCCPSEPWPVLLYTVRLARNSQFFEWFTTFIWIFTLLSMLPAFMSFEVGERLGFGITMVLVIEVAKTTAASYLPICSELLWLDLLIVSSEFFALISLAETCVVLSLSYYTEEHLMPPWLAHLWRQLSGRCCCRKRSHQSGAALKAYKRMENESCAGAFYRLRNEAQVRTSRSSVEVIREEPSTPTERYNTADAKRLVFYEKLFFALDSEAKGYITFEEAAKFLGYAALDLPPNERKRLLQEASSEDETLVRFEFVELCILSLQQVPLDVLEWSIENMVSSKTMVDRRNTIKWRRVAKTVDMRSRIILPVAYITWLVTLFNLDFSDNYATDPEAPMFNGFGNVALSTAGVLKSIVPPLVTIFILFSWYMSRRLAVKRELLQKAILLEPHRKAEKMISRHRKLAAFDSKKDSQDGFQAEYGHCLLPLQHPKFPSTFSQRILRGALRPTLRFKTRHSNHMRTSDTSIAAH
ncbi:hypothetical protein AB1Y20_008878 [Prymnesium parvum]|uniref:Neurotransmitter-gated ion-channel ligand-binding domain-containing protein n=1 Tax=Prymnesium parvum TaxID=97485 RepID=A0AB34IUT0_PRYPA